MPVAMYENHKPSNQFPFKENEVIKTSNFVFYRDNRFTKNFINNRHDLKMSKYNNAGYGYQIFENKLGGANLGSIWFLNQVNSRTTYVRVSRYQSTSKGYFIAVLDDLNTFFNSHGYSLILKTKIEYAQNILNKNYYGKFSKATKGKRGKNDRSSKNVAVDGYSYNLSDKLDTFDKWHRAEAIIDA